MQVFQNSFEARRITSAPDSYAAKTGSGDTLFTSGKSFRTASRRGESLPPLIAMPRKQEAATRRLQKKCKIFGV